MTGLVVHLMRKDLREHRAALAVFLGLAAARAALVGSGIDAYVNDPNLLSLLSLTSLLLTILHGALLVALAVQLVHGDRLVGTTAFWFTRPVRRVDLVIAKLGTAIVALVAAPVLLDALVMVTGGLSWRDAAGAVAEGAAMRLVLVLPVMALASVTADLAGFVVSAIAAFFATLAVEVAFQWFHLVVDRGVASAYSATIVVAALLIAGSTAAFAHQVLTRRRWPTAALICATGLVAQAAANWWTPDFVSRAGLEAGWLDPARVTMTMTPVGVNTSRGTPGARQWLVQATYAFAGAPPNVALAPIGLRAVTVSPDGNREAVAGEGSDVLWPASWLAKVHSMEPLETVLGGVRVLDAPEVPEEGPPRTLAWLADDRYRQYVDGRIRIEVDATLGAVGYRIGGVLPLDRRATSAAGNGRFSILSASCGAGKCTVLVRDAMPAFLLELGRESRVAYVLVNAPRRQALVVGARDGSSRYPVFGWAPFLVEHVIVTERRLVFEAPKDMPDAVDAAWHREAAIAAVEMRDIGTFRVRTVVGGRQ